MHFDPEVYAAVRREFEEKELRAKRDADRRGEEVREKIPAIAAIDRQLSQTGLRIMREIQKGREDLHGRIAAVQEENRRLLGEKAALLEKNGYPSDYTDPRYQCPLCKDAGFVGAPDGKNPPQMCRCLRVALLEASVAATGIGALIARQRFDNFSTDYYDEPARAAQNRDVCREFAARPEGNLLLLGGTGLGKTHLSSAITGEAIRQGYYAVYESTGELLAAFEFERFRRRAGDDSPSRTEKYFACDLLLLDDLGAETGNSYTVSILYSLLNQRINRRAPMVISTNLTPKELRDRYTDRLASRLLGEFRPLLFQGKDVRAQKKQRQAGGPPPNLP